MGTIQIKRGQSAQATTLTLQPGELAITLDKGELYCGTTTGKTLLNPIPPVQSVNGSTGIVKIDSVTGNSGTTDKLKTPRTITLNGAITGSVSFDGSSNVTLNTTAKDVGNIDGGTF